MDWESKGLNPGHQGFSEWLLGYERMCPNGGNMAYEDGEIKCSMHIGEKGDQDEEIPIL